MDEKVTLSTLRDQLDLYSSHLQRFASGLDPSSDAFRLFDELARHSFYMYSYIIDYLENNQ